MIVAVIPAFNEESRVADVIRRSLSYVDAVLVIDDGSRDKTAERAREAGAIVVTHPMNRGLGASLGTGLTGARMLRADIAVTLDADGQHLPEEIPALIAPLSHGHDVVFGSRMLERKGHMPRMRRVFQRLSNYLTFVLFGAWVTDSQSGFRAFSRRALEKIHVHTDHMEVSSEIVSEVHRKKLRFTEVPITSVYTDYSLSKGQSLRVGVKTAMKLLLHRLR
ncbi:glycosyltransferase family 2 protein [Candidatus Uhrbacteria bacterium]|nr:glycosyltransferase family 2 protein [Candidatus Uhrbacteria bacterium]